MASGYVPERRLGTSIRGVGSRLPGRVVSNADLEKIVDTTDEWIVRRTGINQRFMMEPGDSQLKLGTSALEEALRDAGLAGHDLDLVINATVTAETTVPANACRMSALVGATPAAAFDLVGGCSGFVYAMNVADAMIKSGISERAAIVGCDVLSRSIDYSDRTVAVIFGDGAGAMILEAGREPGRGCLYQAMGADGSSWDALYIPHRDEDVPESDVSNPVSLGCIRMRGRDIYKFAVNKFVELIRSAVDGAGIGLEEVAQFVCHQSNARIIEAAAEKLEIPMDKVHINIEKYGNVSAGSIPLVFQDLRDARRVQPGDIIVFVAFGSGLTWAVNVWRV